MSKFNFSLFFLVMSGFLFGQAYFPLIRSNTTWSVQHGDGSQICGLSGGDDYFFQTDTLISGLQYKIIRSYPIVNTSSGAYCQPFAIDRTVSTIKAFMREDTTNRKVYVYDESTSTDALLYDFNLSAGDTLNSIYAGQGTILIVDSIRSTTLINGAIRKIFHLNNSEYYIESIGGSQGLWFPIVQGVGYWEVPICVIENNIQLWGNQCLGTLSVASLPTNEHFKIFPNPTFDFIYTKTEKAGTLTISDICGRIILVRTMRPGNEIIDIKGLKSDNYIYTFESEDAVLMHGKFTVSK